MDITAQDVVENEVVISTEHLLEELGKQCEKIHEKENQVEIEILNDDWQNNEGEDEITIEHTPEYVVADSAEEMTAIIEDYCDRTSNRFSRTQQDSSFRTPVSEVNFLSHKVLWQEKPSASAHTYLTYDGVPYMILGYLMYTCQYGKDKNIARKLKYHREKELRGNETKRNFKIPTKKCGCPAKIAVKRVVKFPDFQASRNTHHLKLVQSKKLKKQAKEDPKEIKTKELFLGILPSVEAHQFHETVSSRNEPVDKEIVLLAQELALKNVTVTDIMKQIQTYVQNEIFFQKDLPSNDRRRYNPSRRDVQNFIHDIREFAQLSQKRLNNLREIFESMQEKDEGMIVHFNVQTDHPDEEEINEDSKEKNKKAKRLAPLKVTEYVFFFQTSIQRHLLRKYGHIVYLVEIHPKKIIKKIVAFRLFLLMVQTNVDHQIVGTIMFNKHNKDALKDALEICKQSNSTLWLPNYFFIDVADEVVDIVAQVFPDVEYFFNSRSCLKTWNEFLSRPSNDLLEHREEVLTYLKTMQNSLCKEDLTTAASFLEQSDLWQNSVILRNWFEEQWLPLAKQWVKEYRPQQLSFIDTDTLCDQLDKYEEILSNSTRNTSQGFEGLVKAFIVEMPVQSYQCYTKMNETMYVECQRIMKLHPDYKWKYGLPFHLLHSLSPVIEKLEKENSEFISEAISFAEFHVTNDNQTFLVSFVDTFPSCTCVAWQQHPILPCIHMCVVFAKMPRWKYDSLSNVYRTNVLLEIDYSCISSVTAGITSNTVSCQTETTSSMKESRNVDSLFTQVQDLLGNLKQNENLFNKDEKYLNHVTDELIVLKNRLSNRSQTINNTSRPSSIKPIKPRVTSLSTPVRIDTIRVVKAESAKVKEAKKSLNTFIQKKKKDVFIINVNNEKSIEVGIKRKINDNVQASAKKPVVERERKIVKVATQTNIMKHDKTRSIQTVSGKEPDNVKITLQLKNTDNLSVKKSVTESQQQTVKETKEMDGTSLEIRLPKIKVANKTNT